MAAVTTAQRRRLRRISNRFLALTFLAAVLLVLTPLLLYVAEREKNPDIDDVGSAYQWLSRTALEGSSPYNLENFFGFVAYYTVRIAGVGVVAFATGTITTRFVSAVVLRGAGMGEVKDSGHIVICGWNSQGREIIRELHAKEVEEQRAIAIVAQLPTAPYEEERVRFIRGNPSNADDLLRAGIDRAECAIVVADSSTGVTDVDDLDARTLMTTLAVESLNPNCYTCVEVVRSENRPHFDRTKADELVVSAEMTGALLAGSANTHGLSRLVTDLITHPENMELYRVDVPASLVGHTFRDALIQLKDRHNALVIALFPGGRSYQINPDREYVLASGDDLLVIAETPLDEDESGRPVSP
jgi:voltage-gated potassium channel